MNQNKFEIFDELPIKCEIGDNPERLFTTIRAPCTDLREAVRGAMRRSPKLVMFVGFDWWDQTVKSAVDELQSAGHSVLFS
jgi:hypothetical protein